MDTECRSHQVILDWYMQFDSVLQEGVRKRAGTTCLRRDICYVGTLVGSDFGSNLMIKVTY